MPLVTDVELAKALGRNLTAIRKAQESGRITKRADGLYDLDEAVAEFNATTHHERGHNNRSAATKTAKKSIVPIGELADISTPETPLPEEIQSRDYAKVRARREAYQALLTKLRYEERAKNLTPTVDVENAGFAEFRTLREACFNIPSRVAALLAGESDVARCQQLLEVELTNVFQAFSDGKLAA